MNLASLLYLPGLAVAPLRTAAVLRNLAAWKHKYPIYFYSDRNWHPSVFSNQGEHKFFTCGNPEVVKSETVHHLPKLAYLYGLQIAVEQRIDAFLTLETDVRVRGDNWDERLFEEFFGEPLFDDGEPVLGGTMFAWSPYNQDMEHTQEFAEFSFRANRLMLKQLVPLPGIYVYGGKGSCQTAKPCCYPNGGGSICLTSFAQRVFGYRDPLQMAAEGSAWDAHLGFGLFDVYGPKGYQRIAPLPSCFSTYGDLLSSEGFRKDLLMSGQCCVVHQVKSEDDCL